MKKIEKEIESSIDGEEKGGNKKIELRRGEEERIKRDGKI